VPDVIIGLRVVKSVKKVENDEKIADKNREVLNFPKIYILNLSVENSSVGEVVIGK